MTELPILFKPDMVDAIIEDRKTLTRRIVNPQPPTGYVVHSAPGGMIYRWGYNAERLADFDVRSPYGQPGDLLYVRETHWQWGRWAKNGKTKTGKQAWTFKGKRNRIVFKDTLSEMYVPSISSNNETREDIGWHKRPSIFMPKWAARLWLKVKSVRVERVQDISEADAKAEGAKRELWFHYGRKEEDHIYLGDSIAKQGIIHKNGFANLWDRINAARGYSFASNPWVFVVEFEKIEDPYKKRRNDEHNKN